MIVRYYLIATEASCYPFLPWIEAVAIATHIKCWSLSKLIILILKVDFHPEQDAAFSTIKYKSQLSMALVDMQNSSLRVSPKPFSAIRLWYFKQIWRTRTSKAGSNTLSQFCAPGGPGLWGVEAKIGSEESSPANTAVQICGGAALRHNWFFEYQF